MIMLINQLRKAIRRKGLEVAEQETKLAVIVDFVQFLAEQEQQPDWMNAQKESAAYQAWVSPDNDIYDEVFADVNPA